MTANPTMRGFAAITATFILAGCSATASRPDHEAQTEPSGPSIEHIHELVPDTRDGTLLVATHEGLYRLTIGAAGEASTEGPIGGLDFDPMGFTLVEGIAYASGHPGPTTPPAFGSPNLGLITSTDSGQTWSNVSLTGETDFHGVTVMPDEDRPARVFGLDAAAGRLERSVDGGLSWVAGAELEARDILAVGELIYATTPTGLAVSSDQGATFAVDPAAPRLYLVASDIGGKLAGVDTSGTIWTRAAGANWVPGRTVDGTPQALAIDGERLYIADDRGIIYSDDAGASWAVVAIRT